jgi:membrane fusion protein, heavy metal efflux system
MLHRTFRLPRLCALALFAVSLSAGAGGQADAAPIALAPAQATALGVSAVPILRATTLALDGLVGSVALPLVGTTVVTPPYGGRIAQVNVDEGEQVTAGQLLAVIDSRDYADDRARLTELASRASVARQQADRDRLLAREGIIATSRATASVATARELGAARDGLAATLQPLADASTGGTIARFELRAPAAGVVVRRHVMTGERVDSLAPAFVLAASTAWRVEVHVPVTVMSRLGRDASLRVGDLQVPITGRGMTLDEQTQTVVVRGELPPDSGLVPGQQIVASLHLPAPAAALEVPRSALLHTGESVGVFVVEDGRYRLVPVTVLAENAHTAVIEAPIAVGAAVVGTGVSALKSLLER